MTEKRTTVEKVAEMEVAFYDHFHTTPEEVAAIKAGEPEAIHAFITRNRLYFLYLANRYIKACPELRRGENADDYVQQLYLDLPLLITPFRGFFLRQLCSCWLRWYAVGGFYYWSKQKCCDPSHHKPADFLPPTVSCDEDEGANVAEYLFTPEEDTPETLYIKAHETHELTAEEIAAALSDILAPRLRYYLQHYLNDTVLKLDKKELNAYRANKNRLFAKLRQNAALVLDRLRALGAEIPPQYANAAPIDTAEYEAKKLQYRERKNKLQNERRRRQRAEVRTVRAVAQGARA